MKTSLGKEKKAKYFSGYVYYLKAGVIKEVNEWAFMVGVHKKHVQKALD